MNEQPITELIDLGIRSLGIRNLGIRNFRMSKGVHGDTRNLDIRSLEIRRHPQHGTPTMNKLLEAIS